MAVKIPLSKWILAFLSILALLFPGEGFHEHVSLDVGYIAVLNAGAAAIVILGPHLKAFGFSDASLDTAVKPCVLHSFLP